MSIFIGLSGGVDSSVSAYLLKEKTKDITGVFMRNWKDDTSMVCQSEKDLEDAVTVADDLKIPFAVVDFHQEYYQLVFEKFIEELKKGLTPNPDIFCNVHIKFDHFLRYALENGAHKIATGHYAQTGYDRGHYRLYTASDLNKDQTYFLYRLTEEQLSYAEFPLGQISSKKIVREIAKNNQLITHNKKDSTGICFIGEKNFAKFLKNYIEVKPGHIISIDDGQVRGIHQGLPFYTLGQRKGLYIGGQKNIIGAWYVVKKSMSENILYVVSNPNHPMLFQKEVIIENLHFIHTVPKNGSYLLAKTRYRQPSQPCHFYHEEYYGRVIFDEPQRSITPGQSLVLYQDNECLGGGIISLEKI